MQRQRVQSIIYRARGYREGRWSGARSGKNENYYVPTSTFDKTYVRYVARIFYMYIGKYVLCTSRYVKAGRNAVAVNN